MKEYHKIQTVFNRDPETNFKKVIPFSWAKPEFEYLANNDWVWTEKVDGTNIRVMWNQEKVTFGGKTDNASIPAFLYTRLQELFPVEKMKEVFPETWACLYGEGYGAKIQKGGGNYNPKGCDFVLFDVMIADWWLKREDVADISTKLEIRAVPIIGIGKLPEMVEKVRNGFGSIWGDFRAEGIVARPEVELKSRSGERIITKLKCKDF